MLESIRTHERPHVTDARNPARISICIVGNSAQTALNFRGALIRDLCSRGARVQVLAPRWTKDERAQLERWGAEGVEYPLSRVGLNPLADLRSLWALYLHLRRERPRVVLTYFAKPNIWGIIAAKLAGVPHRVAMVEGLGYLYTHEESARQRLAKRLIGTVVSLLYGLAFRAAQKVVVLNSDDARDLQRRCGLKADKVVLLGGIGVDLVEWRFEPPKREPITFTLVARLLREKGVFEFIEAARRVKARYPTVRFLLLGGLDENPGGISAAEIAEAVEAGVIQWLGHVDVKPWLRETSVFVLPSYREGLPRSTQEALATGRPVITTDVPGCRETVIGGVNGFLVPARNVDALVAMMERFIVNPELISRMGLESRRMAEERFDVRVVNARLLEVLGVQSQMARFGAPREGNA